MAFRAPRARRRLGRILSGAAFATASLCVASPAAAAPQANVGLTTGVAETDLRDRRSTLFHLGVRGDVLFLRERGSDMALGPYVDAVTHGFETLEVGGGLSWLLPVRDDLPLVLSAGAFERRAPSVGWQSGVASTLFFGSRSYNFHSWYELTAGIFVQGRYGLGDSRQADVILGVQLDLALVAYPWIFLYEAVAH